jgi:hypothetical protein
VKQLSLNDFQQIARERALTPAETDDLDRLLYNERQKQWRLPHRVVLLREKLRQLEARLEPNQARTVQRLQERVDRRRLAMIERELAQPKTTKPKGECNE